jgi:hypothetical protein
LTQRRKRKAKVTKVVCICIFRILVELSVLRIGTKGELHVSGSERISVARTRATPHKDVMVWLGELGYRTGGRPRKSWKEPVRSKSLFEPHGPWQLWNKSVASSRTREVKERVRCGTIPI